MLTLLAGSLMMGLSVNLVLIPLVGDVREVLGEGFRQWEAHS